MGEKGEQRRRVNRGEGHEGEWVRRVNRGEG